jgi:hypothetical protein
MKSVQIEFHHGKEKQIPSVSVGAFDIDDAVYALTWKVADGYGCDAGCTGTHVSISAREQDSIARLQLMPISIRRLNPG